MWLCNTTVTRPVGNANPNRGVVMMPFFLIGDEEPDNPVIRAAGLDGFGLWAAAGAFSMHHLTEGFVPSYYVRSWPNGKKVAEKLVKHGIWAVVDDGYRYIEWKQRSKKQILDERKAARIRQQRKRDGEQGTDTDGG
jgi:hypothetical protein